jgi:hypothetical protein
MGFGPTPKRYIPEAMIKLLRQGPSSLSETLRPGSIGLDANVPHEMAEKVRAELMRNYTLWLETWVIPELERLKPKES